MLPNDISGIVYVTMDNGDSWMYTIAIVIKKSGYSADLNEL